MTAVDLDARIPNNVGLADDPKVRRALEHWQPRYLEWWHDMGPTDFEEHEVYLRTAIDVGAKGAGNAQLMWDGRNDAGVVQPAGSYSVTVTAKDAADQTVAVTQETKGTVTAVSFDKGYPVLHLDTGISVPVSDLLKVDSAK